MCTFVPVYSPLCDVSETAYLAYLSVVKGDGLSGFSHGDEGYLSSVCGNDELLSGGGRSLLGGVVCGPEPGVVQRSAFVGESTRSVSGSVDESVGGGGCKHGQSGRSVCSVGVAVESESKLSRSEHDRGSSSVFQRQDEDKCEEVCVVSSNFRIGEGFSVPGAFGNSCHEKSSGVLNSRGLKWECKKKEKSTVGKKTIRNVPGAFGNSCHEENSGSEIGHGPNWERNKKNRSDQKARKIRRKERQGKWNEIGKMRGVVESGVENSSPFSLNSLVHDQNVELRNSLAAKWKAENALAKLRAERQFAVLSASDLQDEVKQHRTKLNATIERNMVSIEKTHATLRATGNVAGEFHGSAETVMTPGLSSGTISPDSSASMQEFRAVQKENLDLRNKIKIATDKLGIDIEHIDLYDKDIWTNNSVNEAILDEMYPNGYGMDGTFCDEGKVRVIPT